MLCTFFVGVIVQWPGWRPDRGFWQLQGHLGFYITDLSTNGVHMLFPNSYAGAHAASESDSAATLVSLLLT